jgi:hypothetical protein
MFSYIMRVNSEIMEDMIFLKSIYSYLGGVTYGHSYRDRAAENIFPYAHILFSKAACTLDLRRLSQHFSKILTAFLEKALSPSVKV